MSFCTECGKQMTAVSAFCTECGTKVGAVINEADNDVIKTETKEEVVQDRANKKPLKKVLMSAIALVLVVALGFAVFFFVSDDDGRSNDGGFRAGPVVSLNGYTYFPKSLIGVAGGLSIVEYDLNHLYKISNRDGARLERVFTPKNEENVRFRQAYPSVLTPFIWENEVWFFELKDMRNGTFYDPYKHIYNNFFLNHINNGDVVRFHLTERDGRFIKRHQELFWTSQDRPLWEVFNIRPIGAYNNILYGVISLEDVHYYIIAIDMGTGEVSQICIDLANGDRILPIGIYNGKIYYLRQVIVEGLPDGKIFICGQKLSHRLTFLDEEIFATFSLLDGENYFSSFGLNQILSPNRTRFGILGSRVMTDGVFYFMSDLFEVLRFDASDGKLTIAYKSELGIWPSTIHVYGNLIFSPNIFAASPRGMKKIDTLAGVTEFIIIDEYVNAPAIGITDSHLYYIRATGSKVYFYRICYTDERARPQRLNSWVTNR